MERDYYFNQLKEDFEKQKRMVLFVGAGINFSPGVDLSWESLLNDLFLKALQRYALDRGLSKEDFAKIHLVLENHAPVKRRIEEYCDRIDPQSFSMETEAVRTLLNDLKTDSIHELFRLATTEFPLLVKASIVKSILGENYISFIRQHLYSKCNRYILEEKLSEYGKNSRNRHSSHAFHTLYQLGRILLLCRNIKAVVSYNYDNFLCHTIRFLWKNREQFFSYDELQLLEARGELHVHDVAGPSRESELKENDLVIYHVHGYIQSPSEVGIPEANRIVLSLEEYYEDTRNVYSWQSTTQLHFLDHFTCLFAGMSLSDITPQRMLYYSHWNGCSERHYNLCARPHSSGNSQHENAFRALYDLKNNFYADYGILPIFSDAGFDKLYADLGKTVGEICVKNFNILK